MDEGEFIVCETAAAITPHIRRIGKTPPNYGGHAKRPYALCGAAIAWDTRLPLGAARCRECRTRLAAAERTAHDLAPPRPALVRRCRRARPQVLPHGRMAVASWRSYWPGREPLVQCEHHRTWSAHVAEALGFRLVSVPLPVREWPEPDAATQRFRAMEMM